MTGVDLYDEHTNFSKICHINLLERRVTSDFSSLPLFSFFFLLLFRPSSGKNTVRSGSRTRNVGTWITSVRYLESERNIQVKLETPKKSTTRTSDDQKFRESVSWDGIFFYG